MNDYGQVEINGVTYYVPIDYIDYLIVDNGYLINVGTSNITLYHDWRESGINNSGYPRINVSSMSKATYQQTQTSQATILSVNSYEVKSRVTPTNTILLIVLVLVLILNWFKGR